MTQMMGVRLKRSKLPKASAEATARALLEPGRVWLFGAYPVDLAKRVARAYLELLKGRRKAPKRKPSRRRARLR